jgi:hypothetical protein
MNHILWSLILLSLFMAMMGGLQDVTGKTWWASKEHCWKDAQYLLLLVIALRLLQKEL